MCGRYTVLEKQKIKARFNIVDKLYDIDLKPNYNAAPGQQMPVVTHDEKGNHLKEMRWGLVPSWAKDESMGFKTINARAETLSEKPMWKRPFAKHRILIPSNGFYEWRKMGGRKIPYFIHQKNNQLFGFAGLYDIWEHEGKKLYSFTIITTEPVKKISDIHDRMPVILPQKFEKDWLDMENRDFNLLRSFLDSKNFDPLEYHEVSTKVNKPAYNEPDLILKYEQGSLV